MARQIRSRFRERVRAGGGEVILDSFTETHCRALSRTAVAKTGESAAKMGAKYDCGPEPFEGFRAAGTKVSPCSEPNQMHGSCGMAGQKCPAIACPPPKKGPRAEPRRTSRPTGKTPLAMAVVKPVKTGIAALNRAKALSLCTRPSDSNHARKRISEIPIGISQDARTRDRIVVGSAAIYDRQNIKIVKHQACANRLTLAPPPLDRFGNLANRLCSDGPAPYRHLSPLCPSIGG